MHFTVCLLFSFEVENNSIIDRIRDKVTFTAAQ